MALKLAILRTNDVTDDVEEIHLEVDLRAELERELASRVPGRRSDARRAIAALNGVEQRLKSSTVALT